MNSDKKNILLFLSIFVIIIAAIGALVFTFGKELPKDSTGAVIAKGTCDDASYTKDTTNPVAKISTSKGCIIAELYQNDAPKTVENFIGLADKKYYNDLIFHRVIPNFMIQTGDPKGNGTGGESLSGGKFDDELNPETQSYKNGYQKGVLAMANSGPNTNGSQFFITVADLTGQLEKNYTMFGKVLVGQDVADQISQVETVDNGGGEKSKPVTVVKMEKVEILK